MERADVTVRVLRKLPQVTALFWVLKILAVTLGETLGDEFGITLGVGYLVTALVLLAVFGVLVTAQLRADRYRPWLFWAVVLSTSAVGTEISDGMDRGYLGHASSSADGIGYGWGMTILLALLAAVFLVWWRTGQTYDVENIATRQGEAQYWIAILVSNTLGTASGDWLADDTGLGFLAAACLVAVVLLILLGAHYTTALPAALLFWPAFVLTRPLGAAGGDFLTKPVDEGGLGWGTLGASTTLLVLLVVGVAWQSARLRKEPLPTLPHPHHRVTGEPQTPNGALVSATAAD
ncbi:hypothetical protein [Actinomycetospora sp. TBRC 11914]|uniref:COG4705 family protein n=1 Tax=Actinomycetospora sp. TBRC 11914 TaxID=2729387 RepID=UPI001B7D54F2|nr:hypothetical protein [Actinomycetospora sp. TBRC 11914]